MIRALVYCSQTNGKLERAFRDDRREYYDQFKEWIFDELGQGLPEYVRYRNEVRGHFALNGKPSTARLREQSWFALPSVLNHLESYARHSLGTKRVNLSCCIWVLGRNGYIPELRYGQRVSLTGTPARAPRPRAEMLSRLGPARLIKIMWHFPAVEAPGLVHGLPHRRLDLPGSDNTAYVWRFRSS
jgi:hypothetical protein